MSADTRLDPDSASCGMRGWADASPVGRDVLAFRTDASDLPCGHGAPPRALRRPDVGSIGPDRSPAMRASARGQNAMRRMARMTQLRDAHHGRATARPANGGTKETARMNGFIGFAAATLLGTGLAAGALAQQGPGPRIIGSGVDTTIVEPSANAAVFGGAQHRITGSGESAQIELSGSTYQQPGRFSRILGSGDGAELAYDEPAPMPRLAGRILRQ